MAARIKSIDNFWKGFKRFGKNLALFVNSALLFFVYFIGIGITFLLAKALKKKFLDIKKKESYWHTLDLSKKDEEYYYRQF